MEYILLIEDNQANADMTIRILEAANYRVKHVLRGFDGAQIARREKPMLILMDFDLPDVNGRNLTLVLKKQLGPTAPPIVAVTAPPDQTQNLVAPPSSRPPFFIKPFFPPHPFSFL